MSHRRWDDANLMHILASGQRQTHQRTDLKKALKAAQMTYADLARALGLAESSVKRMLARGGLPLSRVDAICRALKLDFAELARRRGRCPADGGRADTGAVVPGAHAEGGAGLRPATPVRPEIALAQREGYTLLLAMRSWEFGAFAALRR